MYNRRQPDFELDVHNNNTIRLRIPVLRDGDAVSLVGSSFKAIFRKWATDSEADALLVITDQSYFVVETPSSGVAIFILPADEATIFEDGTEVHLEIVLTEASGVVTSISDGILRIW